MIVTVTDMFDGVTPETSPVTITVIEGSATTGGGGGVTDHGALTGLADDDHTQYLTNARGDVRYDASGAAATAQATAIAAAATDATTKANAAVAAGGGSGTFRFVPVPWWHLPDSTTGTWLIDYAGSGGPYFQSSGSSGDEAVYTLPIGPGTYALKMSYFAGPNRGIATISVDDGAGSYTPLTTVDQYKALPAADIATNVTGLVVTGAAVTRSLKIAVTTKNGSSSAYYLLTHGFTLRQTA